MIGSNAAITVAFFAATASVAWSAAYAWVKWLPHRHDLPPAPPLLRAEDATERQRLAQLEHMVAVLAEELERLGEGQRYTVRLLEERLPPAPRPAALPRPLERERGVTPH